MMPVLKKPLFTRATPIVALTALLAIVAMPLGALADGMSRVEPFDLPKADKPMANQPFYTDPYTASLLGASQPVGTTTGAMTTTSTSPGYWSTVGTPATTTTPTNTGWNNSPTTTANSSTAGYWQNTSPASYDATSSYQPLQANITYIPKGETFTLQLNDPISTQTARVGDAIRATLDAPIYVNGVQVAPAGSDVSGTVTRVSPATRFGKHGEMELKFLSLRKPSGERVALEGSVVTQDGNPLLRGDTYTMDVLKGVGIAVGGTALGAIGGTAVGGIIGSAGSGAAVGTAIGAAAGIGYAAARKGKSVDLQNGSRLRIKLDQPAAIGSAY
jgi:hypothetical protein